jgi:hypothetical protein
VVAFSSESTSAWAGRAVVDRDADDALAGAAFAVVA